MGKPKDLTAEQKDCISKLKEAFPPSSAQELLGEEDADFLTSRNTYERFSAATNYKLEESIERLKATIEWRKEKKPYLITADAIPNALSSISMGFGGRCKAGRPILIMTLGAENNAEVEERVNLMLYILEVTHRKGYETITWVVDFISFGNSKDDRSKATRKATMKVLQAHYPERLGALYMYHTPWYVSLLLPLVKAFMDKATMKKIKTAGDTIESLEKYIDRSQLPTRMGGTMESESGLNIENLQDLNEPTTAGNSGREVKEQQANEVGSSGEPISETESSTKAEESKS